MKVKGYGHTVIGSREMNQDSMIFSDELRLYAVADGIGGGLKGEVASKMAADGLRAYLSSSVSLREAFPLLQDAIYKEALENFGEPLMGTTLTALHVFPDDLPPKAIICHAGDSRCYSFDGSLLKQLTEDHESFDESFQGAVLNSYLGIDIRTYALKVQEEEVALTPGMQFLICSDGLYKQITEMRLVSLLKEKSGQPDLLLRELCEEAAKAEYSDNITIVLVQVEE